MQLKELLLEEKGQIVEAWVDEVLSSYPGDASKIFKKQKDRFANPIGFSVKNALWDIYKFLFEDEEIEKITGPLTQFVQMRSVQTFAPSDAVSIGHSLKKVVQKIARQEKVEDLAGWYDFDHTVDILTYTLFDMYVDCRERLYKVRLEEFKSRNNITTDAGCPSRVMDDNSAEEASDIKPINLQHDAR